jgi:hypothetical protein
LDVMNRDGSLAPGMYPTVKWPVRRSRPALFVPKTSTFCWSHGWVVNYRGVSKIFGHPNDFLSLRPLMVSRRHVMLG